MKTFNYIKKISFFLLAPLSFRWLFNPLQAQNPDNDMRKKFDDFRRQIEGEFQEFRDSIDAQFVRFMRDNWERFEVFKGQESPLLPDKPVDPPTAPENAKDNNSEKIEPKPQRIDPEPELPPLPQREKELPEEDRSMDEKLDDMMSQPQMMSGSFYTDNIRFSYDPAYQYQLTSPYGEGIPKAWEQLAGARHFKQLYREINIMADSKQLNDWGYLQLVRSVATSIFPNSVDQQVIFSCFVLNKSGYQVKMGYTNSSVFLLIPSYQQVFEKPYLTIEGVYFYVFTFGRNLDRSESIVTYKGQYGNSNRRIDFTFKKPMRLSKQSRLKQLSFEYNYQTYQVNVNYNPTLIDFYQDMPHVDFEVTLSSPLSESAYASIRSALLPLLQGKSEREQVNIILRFVQKAFAYKTDQDQFGVEKYFYPEELMHFPYSDCEDRSAMFSTLVRNMLGLEVIGLIFPNHLATAVRFNENVEGDFLEHEGKRFVICDPTYIGADVGMCMPRFKNAEVTLVLLD
jgi:hypothetical protein